MFVDEITLILKAWAGGDGKVSWRHEKNIPFGGPFGGDGGDGASVILLADENITTLSDYRNTGELRAEIGEKGGTKCMHGKCAEDLYVKVPVGTIVTDIATGQKIADLDHDGMRFLVCHGGRGGYGNAHFTAATRQAPNFAELGDAGEVKKVRLELKLMADIGIIGFPNAGKSTLISTITNVRPKIADYPFTTLIPNLGVMDHGDKSLVVEDVPGLIEWAAEGKGLGHTFLKHIERARTLIHLIALTDLEEMVQSYRTIRKELETYSRELKDKPELVVISKVDLGDMDHAREIARDFARSVGIPEPMLISALAREGIDTLKNYLIENIPQRIVRDDSEIIHGKKYDFTARLPDDERAWQLTRDDRGNFIIHGERIEQIVRMTDTANADAVDRIYDILEKTRIAHTIVKRYREEAASRDLKANFFVGSEDIKFPRLFISGKSFRLENILMRAVDAGQ